jgi:hypothetical protein
MPRQILLEPSEENRSDKGYVRALSLNKPVNIRVIVDLALGIPQSR